MIRKIYSFMGLSVLLVFAIVVHAQASDQGRSYYDLGVFAYEAGDYEGAEKHLKKALDLNPGHALYLHYLGKIYLKTERYDEAMKHLNQAWEKDPDMSGLKNDLALAHYRMQNYSTSAKLFEEIAEETPEDVLAHYHAGISLFKEEKYQRALSRFIMASEKSPTIKTNGYYYAGICHLKMGEYDAAQHKLEYVRDHGDASLRQNALKFLEVIHQRKKALRPYRVYAKLGVRYDSNVRLEPEDEDRYADEDDWALVGYFSGRYNLKQQKPYTLGVGYRHYQIRYDVLDEYNLTGSVFSLYGKYDKGPFGFSLSYLPHIYWLDSDVYIRKHEVQTEVTCNVTKNLIGRFSFNHSSNQHVQDESWTGHTNEYGLKVYYRLKEIGYLHGGVDYEKRTTNDLDHRYHELGLSAGVSLNLPWEITLRTTGRYANRGHDYTDSTYLFEREDDKYGGSVSVSRALFYDWLEVICEFDYTKRDSNITEYDYNRKRTTLSLTARF